MKKQNKAKGIMPIETKGVVVKDAASILKKPKGYYSIGSNFSLSKSQSKLHIYVNKIANGNKPYEITGYITFTVKGKIASASFNGTLYEIQKKRKASAVSSGPILAAFLNLEI